MLALQGDAPSVGKVKGDNDTKLVKELVFIKMHFSHLPATLTSLEGQHLFLVEQLLSVVVLKEKLVTVQELFFVRNFILFLKKKMKDYQQ